jgi:quinolinate synthase
VHERFTAEEIRQYRRGTPDLVVLAHPECSPELISEVDYAGSTAGMINYVKDRRPPRVMMVTECSMSDNVAAETPDVEFIRPCNLCPHMKQITLENILESLQLMRHQVEIPEEVAVRARQAVKAMVDLDTKGRGFTRRRPPEVVVEDRETVDSAASVPA